MDNHVETSSHQPPVRQTDPRLWSWMSGMSLFAVACHIDVSTCALPISFTKWAAILFFFKNKNEKTVVCLIKNLKMEHKVQQYFGTENIPNFSLTAHVHLPVSRNRSVRYGTQLRWTHSEQSLRYFDQSHKSS